MSSYNFEALNDERFQQLCQAVLTTRFPDLQCLPVGQPDGGRDAFKKTKSQKDFVIFQVKFVKEPSQRSERDAIEQLIKSEKSKVEKLIAKGATSYYLLTNVSGTSHLDVGSIDKVNQLLSQSFEIDCHCLWRDDLERRIDSAPAIKWSYPEILKATDLIEVLLESGSEISTRRNEAIRAYLAHQAKSDSQLKFKQVELQKTILDLFVDVPAKLVPPPGMDERQHLAGWGAFFELSKLESPASDEDEGADFDNSFGALELLIQPDLTIHAPKIVVEGAPGQGKSTVTQYLCQVYRLKLLDRPELSKVSSAHRPSSIKIPFRVDLRDYASWLAGRNPFAEGSAPLPPQASPVLESFLSAQIHRFTGFEFSVDDLIAVSRKSQLLIVLDGFDEVADVRLRNKIVDEVSSAVERIRQNALSCQFIVTSRPAAFANSPGFPRDEWQHVDLLPLTHSIIEIYATKWLQGRLDAREQSAFMALLQDKLKQPHVRDLARNPMQLAILLALIAVQGASLPNKRTALYDSYINIFFNREAEKSDVVRDHRDLLIQLHRYLAWKLQSEAEQSKAGNISESELKATLRDYLETNDHAINLVDKLFTGMVERVVALVSRVQGTFEFEVQPLREYFAARYLYDTAPYAPPGKPCPGTLVDRFKALSENFYWLNVTRFYAGCYSSGELASLVDGFDELAEHPNFKHLGYTARLAFTLLSDYVFSQKPKLAAKLAEHIVSSSSVFSLLGEERLNQSSEALTVPAASGREKLVKFAEGLLRKDQKWDVSLAACRLLTVNCNAEERYSLWLRLESDLPEKQWLRLGWYLWTLSEMPLKAAVELAQRRGESVIPYFADVYRFDLFDELEELWPKYFEHLLDRGFFDMPGRSVKEPSKGMTSLAEKINCLLWPFLLEDISHSPRASSVRFAVSRTLYADTPPADYLGECIDARTPAKYHSLAAAADEVLRISPSALMHDPAVWSQFIEAAREAFGDRWGLFVAALNYVDQVKDLTIAEEVGFFDDEASLIDRLISAKRNRFDSEWWTRTFEEASKHDDQHMKWIMLCMSRWMPPVEIVSRAELLSKIVDEFSIADWGLISRAIEYASYRDGEVRPKTTVVSLPSKMSPRVVSIVWRFLSPATQQAVWKRFLSGVEHQDSSVIEICCQYLLGRARKAPGLWAEALSLVAHYYAKGFVSHYSIDSRKKSAIPQQVAKSICEMHSAYPLSFVGAAASELAIRCGADSIPVAKVAARDGWFTQSA